MTEDMTTIIMICVLAGFIISYFCWPRMTKKATLSESKGRFKSSKGTYRDNIYKNNTHKFVKEGAEERIRRRMGK